MEPSTISKKQIAIMSVTAGVCVANIYYNQPILSDIARGLQISEQQVGNLPVFTQAGYGLGLFFITPLGDKVNRKKLILILQALLIVSLLGMSFIRSINGLYVMSLLIGMFSVAAQVIMPMAATLATANKGKVVGIVFTGILTGILSARIFSGYIADWLNWRYVFGISAGLVFISSLFVGMGLPDVAPQFSGNYRLLLKSTVEQVKRFSLLRRIALLGALVFGAFCSFWTTLTFHLSGTPFYYKSDVIGLFGVLAVGGALVAPVFGRLADKGRPARAQLFTVGLIIISILLIQWLPYSIGAFVVATILLDIGVQATQVTSLAQIYTLDEGAHSRINTVYMTTMFTGGAIGTLAGVQSWVLGKWAFVSWQLLLWSCMAFVVAWIGYRVAVRSALSSHR